MIFDKIYYINLFGFNILKNPIIYSHVQSYLQFIKF